MRVEVRMHHRPLRGMGQWLLGGFSALGAVGSAHAAILEPVDPAGFHDVYFHSETVEIEVDDGTSSCTLSCPDASCTSTSWSVTVPLTAGAGSYAISAADATSADPAGLWRLTCGGSSVDFFVGGVHSRLWLDQNTPADLVAAYVMNGPDPVDFRAEEKTSEPPINYSLPAWNANWVRDTAWQYQMSQAIPTLGIDSAGNCVPGVGSDTCGATTQPSTILASGNVATIKGTLNHVLRLGTVALLHDAYFDDDDTWWDDYTTDDGPYDSVNDDAEYFEHLNGYQSARIGPGLVYWGQAIATHSAAHDWSSITSQDPDLARANLVIALAVAYDWAYPHLTLAERRDWRAQLAEETGELATDYPAPSRFETFGGASWPNHTRRRLVTGHHFAIQAAVGIGTAVLWRELSSATWSADRADWAEQAENYFTDFVWAAGSDGASTNGMNYFHNYLEYTLLYVEALRRQTDDWTSTDLHNTWYVGWVENTPRFVTMRTGFDSTTSVTRARPPLGDTHEFDMDHVSALLARVADEMSDDAAQREAWLGHNPLANGFGTIRRDALDALWYADDLAPKADHADEVPASCAADAGQVTLRTGGWDHNDVVLDYVGGPLVGNHDDPYVGAFTLWLDGWLVTAPGAHEVAQRTAMASTLVVDGKGQHCDGCYAPEAVPEPATGSGGSENNGRLVGYWDAGGPRGTLDIDLVSFGTDLTQLYRYDATDQLRGKTIFTQTDTTAATLESLRRYVVWVEGGGSIFVADIWETSATESAAYRFDWKLTTGEYTAGAPNECAVPSSTPGYFTYTNGTATSELAFSGRTTASDGLTVWSGAATREALNQDTYYPSVPSCGYASYVTGLSTTAATITPANAGRLKVWVQDARSWNMAAYPTAVASGGTVRGHHLARNAEAPDGLMLTLLRPYVATPQPGGFYMGSLAANGGYEYKVWGAYDTTVMFRDPAYASFSTTDGSDELVGDVGAVAEDADSRYAVQLLGGTSLTYDFDELISAMPPVSISLHWNESGGITGWLDLEQSFSSVTIDTGNVAATSVTDVTVGGQSVLFSTSSSANTVQFTTSFEGAVSLRTSSGAPYSPRSTCETP